jgi:hypothetical protein
VTRHRRPQKQEAEWAEEGRATTGQLPRTLQWVYEDMPMQIVLSHRLALPVRQRPETSGVDAA